MKGNESAEGKSLYFRHADVTQTVGGRLPVEKPPQRDKGERGVAKGGSGAAEVALGGDAAEQGVEGVEVECPHLPDRQGLDGQFVTDIPHQSRPVAFDPGRAVRQGLDGQHAAQAGQVDAAAMQGRGQPRRIPRQEDPVVDEPGEDPSGDEAAAGLQDLRPRQALRFQEIRQQHL